MKFITIDANIETVRLTATYNEGIPRSVKCYSDNHIITMTEGTSFCVPWCRIDSDEEFFQMMTNLILSHPEAEYLYLIISDSKIAMVASLRRLALELI